MATPTAWSSWGCGLRARYVRSRIERWRTVCLREEAVLHVIERLLAPLGLRL